MRLPPGVGPLHFLVLGVLRFDLARTAEGIAAELGISAEKVQVVLDELEAMGMVDAATEE